MFPRIEVDQFVGFAAAIAEREAMQCSSQLCLLIRSIPTVSLLDAVPRRDTLSWWREIHPSKLDIRSRLERCRFRKNQFVRLSCFYPLLRRCIRTTTELGFRLQPSFTISFLPTALASEILLVPIIQAVGSVAEPGGWMNPQDNGEKSEEKNRMIMKWKRRNTHIKREINVSLSLRCGQCGMMEV